MSTGILIFFLRDVAEIIKAGKVTCKATPTLPVYGVDGLIAQGHEILHTLLSTYINYINYYLWNNLP